MLELNSESFDQKVAQGVTVVDFWAAWCGPCRMFAPHFEAAAKEVPGATFAKVNIDENGEIASQYGVMSIPTVIFFKDGQPVEQFSGARPKDEIVRIVKRISA